MKTLAIDLDGQRTLSFGLGVEGLEPTAYQWLTSPTQNTPTATILPNLAVLPGDIKMFRLGSSAGDIFASPLKGLIPLKYQVVLMDCPPGLGVASVQAILNSAGVGANVMRTRSSQGIIGGDRSNSRRESKPTDRCAAESV